MITGVEVSGSDGRARMGKSGSGKRKKQTGVFLLKEGGSYSGTGRSSGICPERRNGERNSHESMCGEGG